MIECDVHGTASRSGECEGGYGVNEGMSRPQRALQSMHRGLNFVLSSVESQKSM